MATPKLRNPLPVVLLTVFIDLLGFGLLIPVIPQLLANPSSPFYLLAAGDSVSVGYVLLGLLLASFPLAQFIATPVLGQLSDKYGRRPILAVSLAGACLSYVLFALGIILRSIPILFAARVLAGITGGNVSAAQAAVADMTAPAHRARNFGLIGAAFGLGFIVGPYLGGVLSDPTMVSWFNAATPFWFAAALSLVNVLCVVWLFPETLKHANVGMRLSWFESLFNVRKAWRLRRLRTLFGTLFLFNMGLSFLVTFLGVFLVARFGFSQGRTGEYFAFIGVCITLSQVLLPHALAKRFGERRILDVALLASGLGILLMYFTPQIWVLWAATPIFSAMIGLVQANAISLISRSSSAENQGEILGINASLNALSQAVPPVLAGTVAAAFFPEAPMLVSAILITISGVLFIWFSRGMKGKTMDA